MGVSDTFLKVIAPALSDLPEDARFLTIARQLVTASEADQCAFIKYCGLREQHVVKPSIGYLDELLTRSQPTISVESVDYMDYEGCTHVANLNEPFPEGMHDSYDCLIDGGTMEHVFDVKTVVFNYMRALRVGGHLLIATCANNMMGHGFYQYSPEFFYSLFSKQFGFEMRACVLESARYPGVELVPGKTFRVAKPADLKSRVGLVSHSPNMIFIHAQKIANADLNAQPAPIQSDYSTMYQAHQSNGDSTTPVEDTDPSALNNESHFEKLARKTKRAMRKAKRFIGASVRGEAFSKPHKEGRGQLERFSLHNRDYFQRWKEPY